jgi:ketosteroid isomerase-like protein
MRTLATVVGGTLILASTACSESPDEREIQRLRESSNAAIARHDTGGIGAILAENVVVVTSNSVHAIGRAINLDRFADQFRDRKDVVYERRPVSVDVYQPWGMASEIGVWTGSWTDTDGKVRLSGMYFAKWRKVAGRWLVESETYVPRRCQGGSYCQTAP